MKPLIACFAMLGASLVAAFPAAAQLTPPIRGTIALEGTMKKFYDGANKIIVTTTDGVDHVYDVTKDALVNGEKDKQIEALRALKPGTTVVVHYTTVGAGQTAQEIDWVGAQGMQVTEGMVTKISHSKKQITIRYDNGKIEKLRLTDLAAAEAGQAVEPVTDASKVIVYYKDQSGQKVAHYFRKVK